MQKQSRGWESERLKGPDNQQHQSKRQVWAQESPSTPVSQQASPSQSFRDKPGMALGQRETRQPARTPQMSGIQRGMKLWAPTRERWNRHKNPDRESAPLLPALGRRFCGWPALLLRHLCSRLHPACPSRLGSDTLSCLVSSPPTPGGGALPCRSAPAGPWPYRCPGTQQMDLEPLSDFLHHSNATSFGALFPSWIISVLHIMELNKHWMRTKLQCFNFSNKCFPNLM